MNIFTLCFFVAVRSALEVELQCVMQAAARDHIRDRCIQLDQHARSRQEALRNLRSQWQSILDFRQLVVRVNGQYDISHHLCQCYCWIKHFLHFPKCSLDGLCF